MDAVAERAWLSGLFKGSREPLSPRAIDELRACATVTTAERGQVLIKAGATPPGVWIVRRGMVELVLVTHHRRRVVQLLKEGEIVGDSFLALAIDSPYTARTVEQSVLLYIPAVDFRRVLEEHPALAVAWLGNALARLARSRIRIVEVLGRTLDERVARLLIDEAVDGSLKLPQKTLAEMLGVQRSSLNKILGELEERGLIEVGYGYVSLLDVAGLKAVVADERID